MAAVDGAGLGAVLAGSVFLYAGIKGKSVLKVVQSVIQGKSPSAAPAANQITGSSGTAAAAAAPGTAGKGGNSRAYLERLWTSNGGPADTAAFAAAVALAESGGSATVTSSNPDGGTNVGVFQLDTPGGVGAGYTVAQLQDPNLNTQITIMATNGGTDWSQWGDPVTAAVGYHYTPGDPVPG